MNDSFFGDNSNNEFGGTQIMSQGNGGGYLNDSTLSDVAGMGGMTPAKTQVPQDPCLLPCTIKQIKTAPTPAQDETLLIDGRDTAKDNVTIVGRVTGTQTESTHITYTVDDGTGQIEVRFWNPTDTESSSMPEIKNNTYVRCIGKVKSYRDVRSMTGFDIRPITDFDEITYHNLDVIHTHIINKMPENLKKDLSLIRSNYGKNNNNNNNNNSNNSNNNNFNNGNNGNNYNNNNNNNNANNSNSNSNNGNNNNNNLNNSFGYGNNNNQNFNNNNNNNMVNNGNAGMNTSMMSANNNNSNNNNNNNNSMMLDDDNDAPDHPPLHRKILHVMRNELRGRTDESDGCHVDRIFQALHNEDRNEIREAIEKMSSEGHIFSTLDDETYNIS